MIEWIKHGTAFGGRLKLFRMVVGSGLRGNSRMGMDVLVLVQNQDKMLLHIGFVMKSLLVQFQMIRNWTISAAFAIVLTLNILNQLLVLKIYYVARFWLFLIEKRIAGVVIHL